MAKVVLNLTGSYHAFLVKVDSLPLYSIIDDYHLNCCVSFQSIELSCTVWLDSQVDQSKLWISLGLIVCRFKFP